MINKTLKFPSKSRKEYLIYDNTIFVPEVDQIG